MKSKCMLLGTSLLFTASIVSSVLTATRHRKTEENKNSTTHQPTHLSLVKDHNYQTGQPSPHKDPIPETLAKHLHPSGAGKSVSPNSI